ncbi:MAG: DUF6206 family protein [Fidelibacterota bacterium]
MDGQTEIIEEFERGLNPVNPEDSSVHASVLGYGEISTVLQIDGLESVACKRMPLFQTISDAEAYEKNYRFYCRHLVRAGLNLPGDRTQIVSVPGGPVVLYIIQEQLPAESVVNRLIQTVTGAEAKEIFRSVTEEIVKVWQYNQQNGPELELGLDGQLSNWVKSDSKTYYLDTGTPLFRLNGKEQLDPELFLKSAPSFLRWVIRLFFLKEVMTRYYDLRRVLLDMVGNLHKEQRAELIPAALDVVNGYLGSGDSRIDDDEVRKYYRDDRLIWTLFLAFRRLDRRLKNTFGWGRYEFILPPKIER